MKTNEAVLLFENEKSKNDFLSLTRTQMSELEKDWVGLFRDALNKSDGDNCNILSTQCQRLNNQHIIVEMIIQIKDGKIGCILLKRFEFVDVDTYLDFLNEEKKSDNC
jgi:hypothetical protein